MVVAKNPSWVTANIVFLVDFKLKAVLTFLIALQCKKGYGIKQFVDLVQESQKIMLLGGGCSVATEATAETSHYWNLIQVWNQLSRVLKWWHRKNDFFLNWWIPGRWGWMGGVTHFKGEITRQIYHWQNLPIIFEFSLWSHVPNEFPTNLLMGLLMGFCCC